MGRKMGRPSPQKQEDGRWEIRIEPFEFRELGRRGLDAVQDELLEKVLAYNCCRQLYLSHVET